MRKRRAVGIDGGAEVANRVDRTLHLRDPEDRDQEDRSESTYPAHQNLWRQRSN
jgi:hypothetical protein